MTRIRVDNGAFEGTSEVIELPEDNLWIYLVNEDGTDRYVGSLFFDTDHVNGLGVAWGTNENPAHWWDETNPVVIRPPKTEILIHAWHVWESSGGFDWAPTTGRYAVIDIEAMTNAHENAASVYGATSSALITLKVAGYDPDDKTTWQHITDFLEGGLQDAIEVGRIGHIIGRFNNEPPEGEDQ